MTIFSQNNLKFNTISGKTFTVEMSKLLLFFVCVWQWWQTQQARIENTFFEINCRERDPRSKNL